MSDTIPTRPDESIAEPLDDETAVTLMELIDDTPVEHLLDAWLEASLAEVGDDPADQEQVDRLLWVLRRLRQRRAEVQATGQRRVDLITHWAAGEIDKLDGRAAHIERTLENWAHAERERTGRQTIKLPAGNLEIRARRERAVIIGDPKSAEVVRAVGQYVPEAVKTTVEVQPGKVKAVGQVMDDTDVTGWARAQGVDVPEGYQARRVVVADGGGDDPSFAVVPSVVVLVPAPGRDGFTFKAVTDR